MTQDFLLGKPCRRAFGYSKRCMGRMRRIATALAVSLSLLTLVMACAVPNAWMTPEEHSCCRHMHGRCGSMNMPASHNCCQRGVQARHFDAVQPKSAYFHPVLVFVSAPPVAGLSGDAPLICRLADSPQHSPPPLPPIVVSVLRI